MKCETLIWAATAPFRKVRKTYERIERERELATEKRMLARRAPYQKAHDEFWDALTKGLHELDTRQSK